MVEHIMKIFQDLVCPVNLYRDILLVTLSLQDLLPDLVDLVGLLILTVSQLEPVEVTNSSVRAEKMSAMRCSG